VQPHVSNADVRYGMMKGKDCKFISEEENEKQVG